MKKKNGIRLTIVRDCATSLGVVRKGAVVKLPEQEAKALVACRAAKLHAEPKAQVELDEG